MQFYRLQRIYQRHCKEKQCFLEKLYCLFFFASLFEYSKISFFPFLCHLFFFCFRFLNFLFLWFFMYILTIVYLRLTVIFFLVDNFLIFFWLFLSKVFPFSVKKNILPVAVFDTAGTFV